MVIKRRYSNDGYTLIELMIVVAIIAILAAIAVPNYHQYVIKSHRADMMAELHNIAMRINTRKLIEGVYTNISLPFVLGRTLDNGSVPFPANQTNYDYDVMIIDTGSNAIMRGDKMTSSNWRLQAIPVPNKRMAADGTLTYSPNGEKCRIMTNNTTGQQTKKCGMNNEWRD